MANNDRWRDDQERNRYRDDRRWGDRGQGYGRSSDYERAGDRDGGSEYHGYARGYGREDFGRGGQERSFGGNDYSRGFYGADQGYRGEERGPHQDMWGYRGSRSGWDRATDEMSSWFGDEDAARRREMDARQGDQGAQHHRGRGPKGYTRSDERIRDDVNDRLTDDPYVDASEIEVSVSNCEVTLTGTVDSREAKRRAEDCVESVSGVRHVQNNLRVQQGTNQGTAAGTAGSIGIGSTTGAAGTGMSGAQGGSQEAGTSGATRRKTGAAT